MRISTKVRMVGPLLVVACLAAGCDDFLDVNTDPNSPENARVDIRLPAVVTGMVHSVYYGDPPIWTVEWMQQTSYNQETRNYDELQVYEVQDNSPNGWWSYYYAGILNETKLMMEQTDPETDAAYHGIARFISAWVFATATDMWGPVPYTDALEPTVTTPTYDDQPTVYEGVLSEFEGAIAEMKNQAAQQRVPGANDLLFQGDMSRWVKLARVVQARHHLRIAYAPWANSQAEAQAALEALGEGFTSTADDVYFDYPGGEGARNPLWLFQDRADIFKSSYRFVEELKERNDPRLPIMARPVVEDSIADGTIVFHGHLNGGVPEPDSSVSEVGIYFTAEDARLNVASFADAKFTEAEARLILSGPAAADPPYREGIRASMQALGVASADIQAYVDARPALSSVASPLEEIIREKDVANYLKIEPWHDWRRTGYPHLEPVDGAVIAGIPVRIRTPSSELANNAANVNATGIDPGLQGMLWREGQVWWASPPGF